MPLRVEARDEFNFPATQPALYFFLPCDRSVGIDERFEVGETREIVATREPWNELIFVLVDSSHEITGYSDVKHVLFVSDDRTSRVKSCGNLKF